MEGLCYGGVWGIKAGISPRTTGDVFQWMAYFQGSGSFWCPKIKDNEEKPTIFFGKSNQEDDQPRNFEGYFKNMSI